MQRARLLIVGAATIGTAAAVAVSGLIGFVGIIVPHTIRLLVSSSYRAIVPLSLLVGAGFLVLADVLARTVLSPAELPIGVVTAFFGAPFFAVVLRTQPVGRPVRTAVDAREVSVTLGDTRRGRPRLDRRVEPGEWVGADRPQRRRQDELLRALAGLVPVAGTIRLQGRGEPLPSAPRARQAGRARAAAAARRRRR